MTNIIVKPLDHEPKKIHIVKKVKIAIGILAAMLVATGIYNAILLTTAFFQTYTIVKHPLITVKWQKPLEVKSLQSIREAEEKERAINEQVDAMIKDWNRPERLEKLKETGGIDVNEFFNTLRAKESSNGKNTNPAALHNYCANKGMWNEIGYNPQNKFCFKDQTEARLYVAYYIKKNCDGKTQATCECYWNTGTASSSCAYSKGDLSYAN